MKTWKLLLIAVFLQFRCIWLQAFVSRPYPTLLLGRSLLPVSLKKNADETVVRYAMRLPQNPINKVLDDHIDGGRRKILSSISSNLIVQFVTREKSFGRSDESDYDPNGIGYLEKRVRRDVWNPPSYGMELSDILYPPFFRGVWNVRSVLTRVEDPYGPMLFGGESRLQNAKGEIGIEHSLQYRARFIQGDDPLSTVADREFNIREIAEASMGSSSVLNVNASPNKVSCFLLPAGSNQIFQADLIVMARQQEIVNNDVIFNCGEVSQQVIAPVEPNSLLVGKLMDRKRILKQIETISLYEAVPPLFPMNEITEIHCIQRTSTYLLPSQQDSMALQMWQLSSGNAVDVRFYDVTYSKVLR